MPTIFFSTYHTGIVFLQRRKRSTIERQVVKGYVLSLDGIHVEVSPGATPSAHGHDAAPGLPLIQGKGTLTPATVILDEVGKMVGKRSQIGGKEVSTWWERGHSKGAIPSPPLQHFRSTTYTPFQEVEQKVKIFSNNQIIGHVHCYIMF